MACNDAAMLEVTALEGSCNWSPIFLKRDDKFSKFQKSSRWLKLSATTAEVRLCKVSAQTKWSKYKAPTSINVIKG